MTGPCLCGDPLCGRCFPKAPKSPKATHFTAVKDGHVVGTRSSTSRHAEGQGRFGLYTHAVLRTTRTSTKIDGGESVSWASEVISWHGGAANAAAGLREAHVGAVHCYDSTGHIWAEDRTVSKTGWRALRPEDPETHRVVTYMNAELVAVIVTQKKAKIGSAL